MPKPQEADKKKKPAVKPKPKRKRKPAVKPKPEKLPEVTQNPDVKKALTNDEMALVTGKRHHPSTWGRIRGVHKFMVENADMLLTEFEWAQFFYDQKTFKDNTPVDTIREYVQEAKKLYNHYAEAEFAPNFKKVINRLELWLKEATTLKDKLAIQDMMNRILRLYPKNNLFGDDDNPPIDAGKLSNENSAELEELKKMNPLKRTRIRSLVDKLAKGIVNLTEDDYAIENDKPGDETPAKTDTTAGS